MGEEISSSGQHFLSGSPFLILTGSAGTRFAASAVEVVLPEQAA